MTMMRLADMTDLSLRARWARRRRVIIPVIIAFAVVGVFLLWGPIGLCNGPLTLAGSNSAGGGIAQSTGPIEIALPIDNNGAAPAPAANGVQQQVAFEVAAPPRGRCWVLTTVVVHYHVGIRYYTAAAQNSWAECAHGSSAAQLNNP